MRLLLVPTSARPFRLACLFVALGVLAPFACKPSEERKKQDGPKATAEKKKASQPKRLYLPDDKLDPSSVDLNSSDANVTDAVTFGPAGAPLENVGGGRCPPEMVLIAGSFCIDRFEVSLVDAKSGRELSPYYPPSMSRTKQLFQFWARNASDSGRALGRNMPVPEPPTFQLLEDFAPRATSLRGQLPSGYLSRGFSETACKNSGKRLCAREEWVRACRGERGTRFPYGDEYKDAICNVHRESHPATLLHGNASTNHMDPRLGLTGDDDGPLLRPTGGTSECVSRWGNDAVYDMVGNLDEWIDDPEGTFLGGFYSRGTREGCDASIDVHDPGYLDYSLGTRCCLDPP